MDTIYGNYFFNKFYEDNGGGNYTKEKFWEPFFEKIAQNIIDRFNPKTVLDAGCAMGYLVDALRKKGVEAYGFDISEYAISKVSEEAKPYCFVHSITDKLPDNLPQTFDLVVTIEVLEHLFPEEGTKAIKNLCKYSDTIIFTSTPSDIEDMTHVNVQQPEYWCKEFAKNSFFRDLVQPVDFICEHAMLFRKRTNFENVIFDYELYNRVKNIKLNTLCNEKDNLCFENKTYKRDLTNIREKYKGLLEESEIIDNQYNNLLAEFEILDEKYNSILNAQWWKITKPFRLIVSLIKKIIGFGVKNKIYAISAKDLQLQKEKIFNNKVKISIIVPLYNTPNKFLKALLDSVCTQTYANWELCLADGSDKYHSSVQKICDKYATADKRIKYRKLDKNLGISENTNECIKMSTGEYIALLDHDDILHRSALFEVMKVIDEENADFIFTDEAVFKGSLNNIRAMHFKPDFALDNLRANNYICHFTVFKRDLLDEVGMFRKEFDGSQDHDMVLRLAEKAKKIIHIPKILYFWRVHKESVAFDISSKSYAIESGIKAVKEHLKRCNLNADVESSKLCPTVYRIKYKLNNTPLVSILIPNKDHISDLNKCINSIVEKSTYNNFEIIIIENNSVEKETFDYYKKLELNDKIKIIEWKSEDFNYSEINNFGAKFAKGEHLILLNNDTEIITENWIEEMLMYSQRKDVGAVGAKLYYPDDTVQHGGIIIGLGGVAGHSHKGFKRTDLGYMGRLSAAQEFSAVTGACMMIPKHVFEEVKGFDELFEVAFNDVDLCMRIRKAGYKVIWTPYAELYHYESKSRGYDDTTLEKRVRLNKEKKLFKGRWAKELKAGDPFYNPNLTVDKEDFSYRKY